MFGHDEKLRDKNSIRTKKLISEFEIADRMKLKVGDEFEAAYGSIKITKTYPHKGRGINVVRLEMTKSADGSKSVVDLDEGNAKFFLCRFQKKKCRSKETMKARTSSKSKTSAVKKKPTVKKSAKKK